MDSGNCNWVCALAALSGDLDFDVKTGGPTFPLVELYLWQSIFQRPHQWRIQDFPEEGAPTLKEAIIWSFFTQKLHEIERIWTPGGGGAASLALPLDPPMHIVTQ